MVLIDVAAELAKLKRFEGRTPASTPAERKGSSTKLAAYRDATIFANKSAGRGQVRDSSQLSLWGPVFARHVEPTDCMCRQVASQPIVSEKQQQHLVAQVRCLVLACACIR